MKFGCCAPIQYYHLLEELGFDFIELSGREIASLSEYEFGKWVETIKNGSIPCFAINDYCSQDIIIAGPDYHVDKAKSYAELLCDRGSRLGVQVIGVGAPASRKLPVGFDRNLAEKQAKEFVNVTCEIAEKYGITILWESCNSRVTNFHTTLKEAVNFVRDLQLNNLKLVIDFYHMYVEGEDLSVVKEAIPHTVHLHVAMDDYLGRKSFLNEKGYSYHKDVIKTVNDHGGHHLTLSVEPHPNITENDIRVNGKYSLDMLKNIEQELAEEGLSNSKIDA